MSDYQLSIAARFWGMPPYELEARDDAVFWISRALTFKQAENLGQEIYAARQRQKQKVKGNH